MHSEEQKRYQTKIRFAMDSEEQNSYATKIRFRGNPIQAVFLKKRSVERLLSRDVGKTIREDFAKETKTKIEMESMLIDCSGENQSGGKDNSDGDSKFEPKTALKIPPIRKTIALMDLDDEKYPELSCYDSDEESEWSLPGGEDITNTDIRYIYGEDDYCDSERRERETLHTSEMQSESSNSGFVIEFLSKHITCRPEIPFTFYDLFRCI